MKDSILKENVEEDKMKDTREKEQVENVEVKEEKNEVIENKQEVKEEKKFEKSKEKHKKVKAKMDKMSDKKAKKKWIIPTIILGVILIIVAFFSVIFSLVNVNNENIMSGISIEGVDVSGLSKEEAIAKIKTIYDEKKQKEIGIQYQEYTNTLNQALMEVNYEIEKAADQACLIGRNSNIIANNYEILYTLIAKKNIEVNVTLNEEVTKQTIEDIGVSLPGIVIESSYAIEGEELIITKGKEGIKIDTEKLLQLVKEKLNDINAKEDYITIPVFTKTPEVIDIQKIHDEVYKEAKDAYYTKEPFTVYPEEDGVDFDVENAKTILAEEKEEYVIPLIITKPNVTLSQIGPEAFPDRLSYFTTRYDASDVNRTANLIIACQKINGKVILPGETFSYNKALGPRTVEAGYRNGKIYSGGQVVDGIGGGICQISSTLYNAVLMANLEIVERRNHQFVTSYLPAGRDATVVYGAIDFRFKNTRQYPITLKASCRNGIATIEIFGIKEQNEYTFTFSTKTVATLPFSTQYVEDPSLETGTEKVKQKGANGHKTETYITKSLNGKVISTTLLSKDTYNAMNKIVIIGTKGTSASQTSVTTPVEKPIQTTPIVPEIPDVPEESTQQPDQNLEEENKPEITPNESDGIE